MRGSQDKRCDGREVHRFPMFTGHTVLQALPSLQWVSKDTMARRADQMDKLRSLVEGLRLRPELVPAPLWGISAFKNLRRNAAWAAIRDSELQKAGNRCSVCGIAVPQLICHERWDYDDAKGTATLIGFQIHCSPCDSVTHIGLAYKLGRVETAVAQLCSVNGIPPKGAALVCQYAMTEWKRRSKKPWILKVQAQILKRYPLLAELVGLKGDPRRVSQLKYEKRTKRPG